MSSLENRIASHQLYKVVGFMPSAVAAASFDPCA
jgi:hypothetical protein